MERNGGSKKAIIIGISDYDLLQPLNFCKTDGIKMHELLRSLGYEILENHKLIGRVNRDDLRNAIIEFFRNRNVKLKDTLLFYYSGHGVLDAYGDPYLAPSALNPFEPDTNGYPFDELTKMIRKSISQKIVTILDCCYSGAATLGKGSEEDAANAGRKAIEEKSHLLESGEGRCLLAASQAYQKAFETTQKNHSLFTYYLLEGLSGQAIDNEGYVTPDSLGKYAYDKIMSLPSEERPMQKPIRKVEASGDIVLAYYPQQRSRVLKNTQQIENPMLNTLLPSIESISDKDPSVSIPAAAQLSRQTAIKFKNFSEILKQEDFSIVNQYVLRTLSRTFPKQSASILLKMILKLTMIMMRLDMQQIA